MGIFRYNNETGIFQIGSGDDGTYYFSTYLSVYFDQWAYFDMEVNNETVCTAFGDHSNIESSEAAHTSCSAVVNVIEGKYVYSFINDIDVYISYYYSCTPFFTRVFW